MSVRNLFRLFPDVGEGQGSLMFNKILKNRKVVIDCNVGIVLYEHNGMGRLKKKRILCFLCGR
jgi:hypothetical protein